MEALLPFVANAAMLVLAVFALLAGLSMLFGRAPQGVLARFAAGPALLLVAVLALLQFARHHL